MVSRVGVEPTTTCLKVRQSRVYNSTSIMRLFQKGWNRHHILKPYKRRNRISCTNTRQTQHTSGQLQPFTDTPNANWATRSWSIISSIYGPSHQAPRGILKPHGLP